MGEGWVGRRGLYSQSSKSWKPLFPSVNLMMAFLEALHFRMWLVGFPCFYLTIFPDLRQVSKWGKKILIHTFNTHLLTVGNSAREIVVDQGTKSLFSTAHRLVGFLISKPTTQYRC